MKSGYDVMELEPKIESDDFEVLVRDACGTSSEQSEKATIYRWLDGSRDQRKAMLLIDGASGSGKTGLVRKVITRSRRRGMVACVGNSDPSNGPYAPFALVLQRAIEGPLCIRTRDQLVTFLDSRPELWELMGQVYQLETQLAVTPAGKDALYQVLAHALLILADLAQVICNPSELRDALTNHVLNAVDAMPHGGKLSISTAEMTDWIRIEI